MHSYLHWTSEPYQKYIQSLYICKKTKKKYISQIDPKFTPQDPFNMLDFWTKFHHNQCTFACQIGSQAQLVTFSPTQENDNAFIDTSI